MKTSSSIKRIGPHLIVLFLYFIVTCLTASVYLTNEFTPNGDGNRIFPFLSYIKTMPETFPFWEAFSHFGYPFLANPEDYSLLLLFTNPESQYFNISLNLTLFLLSSLFAFICYLIAIELKFTRFSAVFVGLFLIISDPMLHCLYFGHPTIQLGYIFAWASIYLVLLAVRHKKNYVYLLIPSMLFFGLSLSLRGYYILITFVLPAFLIVMAYCRQNGSSLKESFFRSSLLTVLISVGGFFVAAFKIFPVLDGVISSSALNATYAFKDDANWYWFTKIFSYGSPQTILFFPLLACALPQLRKNKAFQSFILLMAPLVVRSFWGGFDFLSGLNEYWHNTPILRNFRLYFVFIDVACVAAAFITGLLIHQASMKQSKFSDNIIWKTIIVFICVYFTFSNELFLKLIPYSYIFLFIISAAIIFSTTRFFVFFITLFVIVSITPSFTLTWKQNLPLKAMFKLSPRAIPEYGWGAKNQYFRDIIAMFDNSEDYFNTLFFPRGIGVGNKLQGFSMVFPKEARVAYSLLFNTRIKMQRPHWIPAEISLNISDWNMSMLRLLNIKYFYFKGHRDHNPDKSLNSMFHNIDKNIFMVKNWESSLRVFNKWKVEPDEKKVIQALRTKEFDPFEMVLLEKDPGIKASEQIKEPRYTINILSKTADTFSFTVTTNANGILFIPELYSRYWQARVNGRSTPLIRADYCFRGVALNKGMNIVHLKFTYLPFYLGLYTSLIFICIIYFFLNMQLRKKHSFVLNSLLGS